MATFSERTSGRRRSVIARRRANAAAAGKRPTHARPNLPTCLGHAVPVNGLADRRRHSPPCFRKIYFRASPWRSPGTRAMVRARMCRATVGGGTLRVRNINDINGSVVKTGGRPGRHQSRQISNKPNLLNNYITHTHTVLLIFQRVHKKNAYCRLQIWFVFLR